MTLLCNLVRCKCTRQHVTLRYTRYMSELNDDAPVHGLVDSRRAAAMLGVPTNTFKVWANRSRTATSGIAAAMPKPLASMHGQVYLAEEIEEFGRLIALNARAPRSKERELGAYFTPDAAANLMAHWAIRAYDDTVLEPSLGDGRFAVAAQEFARAQGWPKLDIHACELDEATGALAVSSRAVSSQKLHVGDFLATFDLPKFDAVIGNPPYVRLRELNGSLRRNALQAAEKTLGVAMDNAGSVWMPFVAKAAAHLKSRGRLALVLPLDFTYVRYARPLWEFLGDSFGRIRILRFRERVFTDILQNVLILLAEDRGGTTDCVELLAHDRLADLPNGHIGRGVRVPLAAVTSGERAFQHALLPSSTRETLEALRSSTERSYQRAKFNIGYVSGNKTFFHPDPNTVKRFKLPLASLRPTLASSRQLSREALRTSSMSPSSFLWMPASRLTKGEKDYIAAGEAEAIDMAYKCRIRKPWFCVPGVKTPDLVLTTFSDLPRLHLNDAGWAASNSVLAGFMRPGENSQEFVASWYTPLTLLSAEIEVHSLGGGVMIVVPNEADAIQLLNKESTLTIDAEELDSALRSRDLWAAYAAGSRAIVRLVGDSGLEALWAGVETLTAWRKSESR